MRVHPVWRAGVIAAASLASLAGAVAIGNFAPGIRLGIGWLLPFLLVPCSIGLPTTLVTLGVVSVWPGGALPLLLCTGWLAGTLAQQGVRALWRRLARRQ